MAAEKQINVLSSALKTKPCTLNLSNRNLKFLSDDIGRIKSLKSLILRSNYLRELPPQLKELKQLKVLNLGNNDFKVLPEVLYWLESLETLHIFNNAIACINPKILVGLEQLRFLNLNCNQLTSIPKEINRLSCLQVFSLDHNNIAVLPPEICQLFHLVELTINSNQLESLPEQLAFLKKLQTLKVRKNKLAELPEGLSNCVKLKELDVAGNFICSFPEEILKMRLDEFHCEGNSLAQHKPVVSSQDFEVLTLKEQVARYILMEIRNRSSSLIEMQLAYNPLLDNQLKSSKNCAHCGDPFLDTWLECIQFVNSKKVLGIKNNAGIIPITRYLCSYKCFNQKDHEFYGVAHMD